MAGQPDLGVIGVAQIGTIEVGMVLWAQARGTGIGAACGQTGGMGRVDLRAALRQQGHHLPVARCRRLAVFSRCDPEKRARATPGCCQPAQGWSDSENRS